MAPDGGGRLRCSLVDYDCVPAVRGSGGRPRGFGVMRDLQVAADNTPRRSPAVRWEAFADGHDIVLRNVADGRLRRLTSDGRADAFRDPESIAWSPDYRLHASPPVRFLRSPSAGTHAADLEQLVRQPMTDGGRPGL